MPLRSLAFQMGQIDARLSELEKDMATIKNWGARVLILVLLWAMALRAHLEADKAAEFAIKVLKAL